MPSFSPRALFATVFLAVLALLGTKYNLPLFFGVDFLFGSIFVFMALRQVGLASGMVVALAAGGYTVSLWGHPYALIGLLLETLLVGAAIRREQGRNLPAWVLIYWLACGLPLVAGCYHLLLGMAWEAAGLVAFKQAVNEVFNALVATLALQFLPHRWLFGKSGRRKQNIHHLQTNLLAAFAFLPALVVIAFSARLAVDSAKASIKQRLVSRSAYVSAQLALWQQAQIGQLAALANLGPGVSRRDLQLVQRANPDFLFLHVIDPGGKVSLSTVDDAETVNKLDFADRDWFHSLVETRRPALSDALLGRTTGLLNVSIATPMQDGQHLTGVVLTSVGTGALLQHITAGNTEQGTRTTLVDGKGFIIGSTEPSFKPMQSFKQARSGKILEQDGSIYRWEPSGQKSAMQAWSESYYVTSSTQGLAGWTLVIAQSLSAHAAELQYTYLISFAATFFLALGIFLLGSRVSRVISRPLSQLSHATAELSRDINVQAEQELPDSHVAEIAALADHFRMMAQNVRGSHEALTRAHDHLERRVKERTQELQLQKDALDQHAIVSITDAAGNITYANDKFTLISGYRRDELLGQNHRLLNSGQHPRSFFDDMWLTISQGQSWHGDVCNRAKDGRLYWVTSTIVPFLDQNGVPYQYVSMRTDITERKGVEERLVLFQRIFEASSQAIRITDQEGRLQYCNAAHEALLGYRLDEVRGRPVELFLPETEAKATMSRIMATLTQGQTWHGQLPMRRKDGRAVDTISNVGFVKDAKGQLQNIFNIFSDFSEELARRAEILQAKEEAERANQAKSEFLSSMSHELRTPMNAILGFSQMLEYDEDLNEEQKDSVNEILKAGRHLLELINEVLDLSKIESGHIDLSLEPVSLSDLVMDCRLLIQPLAAARQIDLAFDIPAGSVVRADRTRLKQALVNLLSNAVKYNREGGSIHLALKSADKDRIRITVTDTGAGIPPERMNELFQPFSRLDADRSGIEGAGIGLTITQRLVDLMGGEIGVESRVGTGSTFWIELPAETGLLSDDVSAMADVETQSIATVPERRVLCIDDNPMNLRLIAQILGMRRHIHLMTAHTPELGIDLARAHHPDLILLDINMPNMDGYQVLKVLRANPQLSAIPVVAITANAMPRDIERGRAAGFAEYLTKPIDIGQFLKIVDDCLLDRG